MLGAILLIVGDELLAGEIPDRNGSFLAEELITHGFHIQRIHILSDDDEAIAEALCNASGSFSPRFAARSRPLEMKNRPGCRRVSAWAAIHRLYLMLKEDTP